jgi:hypothetical protein
MLVRLDVVCGERLGEFALGGDVTTTHPSAFTSSGIVFGGDTQQLLGFGENN